MVYFNSYLCMQKIKFFIEFKKLLILFLLFIYLFIFFVKLNINSKKMSHKKLTQINTKHNN